MGNVTKAPPGEPFPAAGGGTRLHHPRDADITAAFEVELPECIRDGGGIRGHPRHVVQGNKGAARLLGAAQAGLVCKGGIPPRLEEDGHGLPGTEQRDAL